MSFTMEFKGHKIEMTTDPIHGLEILDVKCPNDFPVWFAVICGGDKLTVCNVWKTDPCSDCPILEHYQSLEEKANET